MTLFLTFSGIVSFGLDFKKQKSTEQFPYTKHKIMEDVCTYSIGFGRKQLPKWVKNLKESFLELNKTFVNKNNCIKIP